MKAVRIILNVIVVAYIVLIALLLSGLLDASTFFNLSTQEQVYNLYKVLLAIGAVLLLIKVFISHVFMTYKKHDLHMAQVKITELKAELYEERQAFRNSPAISIKPGEATRAGN